MATIDRMRYAQREHAARQTEETRATMVAAQRQYEAERAEEREHARREEHAREVDRIACDVAAVLVASEGAVPRDVAGVCSRRHAEYIMMAASVGGGAIYVALPPDAAEPFGGRFLALGDLGVQVVCDGGAIVEHLRTLLVQWSRPEVCRELEEDYILPTIAALAHMTGAP